jgi:predicted permease
MTAFHRAFRVLLHLLPRAMREDFGGEMETSLADDLRRVQGGGAAARLSVFALAALDLIRRAPYEHWRRRASRRHIPQEPRMSFILSDIRFAWRSFARQPGATALIVTTLALAIAANTAVFAVVDAVFVRSLPYPNASRLVDLNETAPRWGLDFTGINFPDFVAWRTRARAFESMGLWDDSGYNVYIGNTAERMDGQQVTYDLPQALGIRPVLGRSFTAAEDVPKGPDVVMIGYGVWQDRFAGSRDVIGKTIHIGGKPWTIIGVLPPNVTLDGPSQLWTPLRGDPGDANENYSYEGVGRLKPGISIEQGRKDLYAAHEVRWRKSDTSHTVSPRIMPLRDRFVSEYKAIGGALGAGVALVLLIACANVAGTMLARSVFRRREMGIRLALGASTGRLTRQLMTEALTLAAIAGVLGTILGRLGVTVLMSGIQSVPPWLHLTIDARAVAFSILVVLVTTLLFGIAPALQLRRQAVTHALTGGPRTAGSLPERRVLNTLVVVEVALAAVLLVTGGLLLRAHRKLLEVDAGFRADGVATFRVALVSVRYRNGMDQRRFYAEVVRRLNALPGVDAAGAVTCAPFGCHWGAFYAAEGAAPTNTQQVDPVVLTRLATPGYFKAMGIRLLRGRFFAENEGSAAGPRPVVINDLLAKQLWPDGSDPIGKRFNFRGNPPARNMMTVVGVVKDVQHYGLSRPMIPGLYMSTTAMDSANSFERFSIVAHTPGDPAALFAPMRAVVRDIDPELPLFDLKTMRTSLNQSLAPHRALTLWLGLFAALALTLAIGGIYAMLSYVVGRRRHEIGIRMALGAQTGQVLRVVVRHGLRLVAIGLVIGIPASLVSTKLLASQLVGITARDPLTYTAVILALIVTGTIAALIPARRAAEVDPRIVLAEAS